MGKLVKRSWLMAVGAAIALVCAACAPFTGLYRGPVTATTGTYRIGPFNLAPMGPAWL